MKTHPFNPKNLIYIIEFLATFKMACNTNDIFEGVAMWVLPHFVHKRLGKTFNSCMCAENRLASLAASVRNQKRFSRKLLRLYPEIANYFLKKFVVDQAIA